MQHRNATGRSLKLPIVLTEGAYRRPGTAQHQIEDHALMGEGQRPEFKRHGEGQQKVFGGHPVGRQRIRRLMRKMGIEAIYRKPNLSRRHAAHPIYPYLLRNLNINRPNQVWTTDIT